MALELHSESPLILTISEDELVGVDALDAGTAYSRHLQAQVGEFETRPLGDFVDAISETFNPRNASNRGLLFEYVDLREIDDVFGQVLDVRTSVGADIGSTKTRFQTGDILFAKIMPSLANKKVALVTQQVTRGVASTEFIVLRPRQDAGLDRFYLFRALRSDHFTRQAQALVSGMTGRQRITPQKLLQLHIIVAPEPLRRRISEATEREFSMRTQAYEEARAADDEAVRAFGSCTRRTQR